MMCRVPNDMARELLTELLFGRRVGGPSFATSLAEALELRDHMAFGRLLRQHLYETPLAMVKVVGPDGQRVRDVDVCIESTEATFHQGWLHMLNLIAPRHLVSVSTEVPSAAGRADMLIRFVGVNAVWILEFGVTKEASATVAARTKLAQAQAYAQAYSATHDVRYGAVVVSLAKGKTASKDAAAAADRCVVLWDDDATATSRSDADADAVR